MEISIKTFGDLKPSELYDALQLRMAVFVVEQQCIYQDLDGKDGKAMHALGTYQNKLLAYTRIFRPGDYLEKSSIGRVVVHPDFRKYGYGKLIMKASMDFIRQNWGCDAIEIAAQSYLIEFYRDLGFIPFGEMYLEDGISHIQMLSKEATVF